MNAPAYQPGVHRLAITTLVLALLPIGMGALVTTLGAGMAFLDWPTSDGENMLLYPWLKDLANGQTDKFVEHGHRLGGVVIGIASILLTTFAWKSNSTRTVKWLATAVLVGVVLQGLLGGIRVRLNSQSFAMIHGCFAAVVFALMGITAICTSRRWMETENVSEETPNKLNQHSLAKPLAISAVVLVFAQFFIGSLLRHFGARLHEHIALGVLVFCVVISAAVAAFRTGDGWLKNSAIKLLLLVILQIGIGIAAYVTKFGWPASGYVAVQHSMPQIAARTAHTIVGMFLFVTAVTHLCKMFRLAGSVTPLQTDERPVAAGKLSLKGGA